MRVSRQGGKSDTNLFTVSSPKRRTPTKKDQKKLGELVCERRKKQVGKSNDKFLGPRVPGVAGDNSRV